MERTKRMMDATQSKWLQEIKVYVEREGKKSSREMIICAAVMLVIGIVGFGIAFSKYMLWGIPLGYIMVEAAVIIFLMGISMGINVMNKLKKLEKMIANTCPDEEKVAEFDREFMNKPKDFIEIGTECYIFTEHYMMHLYKDIWELHKSQLLRYSEVSRVCIVSHIKCFFYRENAEHPFLRVKFSKNESGREVIGVLRKMLPGIITEK